MIDWAYGENESHELEIIPGLLGSGMGDDVGSTNTALCKR